MYTTPPHISRYYGRVNTHNARAFENIGDMRMELDQFRLWPDHFKKVDKQ